MDPKVRSRLRPCRSRLVSADSSPLTVKGELDLKVGFPGHVVCGGQYWFGWPAGYGSPAVVPATSVGSSHGTVVGGRPFDATVSAISVALADSGLPNEEHAILPEHLEDIVAGSHPSLGDSGRQLLRDLLYRYRHVFPAPGDPVTGRTTSVQHDILTLDARPVHCGPRRLAPAGLRTEQKCVQDMLLGGQIEPSDSPWASPVVLVTKKDGSTRFCECIPITAN